MFGLEDQKKKKKVEAFVFDLEKELKDPRRGNELKKNIEERVQEVKATLRTPESKEDYDKFGILLHGYTAVLKVFENVLAKSK